MPATRQTPWKAMKPPASLILFFSRLCNWFEDFSVKFEMEKNFQWHHCSKHFIDNMSTNISLRYEKVVVTEPEKCYQVALLTEAEPTPPVNISLARTGFANLNFSHVLYRARLNITWFGLWSKDNGIAFIFVSHITPLESPTFATINRLSSTIAIKAVVPAKFDYTKETNRNLSNLFLLVQEVETYSFLGCLN